jgi:hypothetical protein
MFFIYGMIVFLEPLFRYIQPLPFALRGLIYMGCIFAGEFLTGSLLKRADICPWDYSGQRFQVAGIIRLDYAPAWFAAGLFFERIYWFLTG